MNGLIAIAVLGAGSVLLVGQNRMNYSLVSHEGRTRGAGGWRCGKLTVVRHLPAGAGASR